MEGGREGGREIKNHSPNGNERVTQPVKLALVLALGGLYHKGARDGPGHGGGVKAIVLQALGHVLQGREGGTEGRREG